MPRNLHIKAPLRATRVPAILRTHLRKEQNPQTLIKRATPRLWNAKRRIKNSQGLSYDEFKAYRKNPTFYDWRSKHSRTEDGKDVVQDRVSPDVAAFLDANPNLLQSEKNSLLRSPSQYFSRPYRVPIEQRKQVYLPNFNVIFIRTPRLGPYYAHFQVPLWFNKLDMKSYLTNVYDVDTVHIRSYVTHGKKSHREAHRAGSSGPAYRMKSKKRMTVQLVEPFEWPKEVEDFTEWEQTEYWRSLKAQVDINKRQSKHWINANPNQHHRTLIAKQAQELLKGKTTWKPTWTQIPSDQRVMNGLVGNFGDKSKSRALGIPPPMDGDTSSPLIPPPR